MIKPKILIVDDSIAIIKFLEALFQNDYEVITRTSGTEAFRDLSIINPDVIVLDQDLGEEVTGLQLLQVLKNSEFLSYIPVVMLSGEQSAAFKIKCFEAGAEDVMSKPFNPQELLLRVDRALHITTALAS